MSWRKRRTSSTLLLRQPIKVLDHLVLLKARYSGPHEIDVIMDGQKINEAPILVPVRPAAATLPEVCLIGKKYRFDVDVESKDDVRIEIADPQGKQLPVQLEDLPDGGVGVSCRFKQVGNLDQVTPRAILSVIDCFNTSVFQLGQHSIDVYVKEEKVGTTRMQKVADPVNGVQLVSEVGREIVGQSTELKLLIENGLENEVEVEIEGAYNIFSSNSISWF